MIVVVAACALQVATAAVAWWSIRRVRRQSAEAVDRAYVFAAQIVAVELGRIQGEM